MAQADKKKRPGNLTLFGNLSYTARRAAGDGSGGSGGKEDGSKEGASREETTRVHCRDCANASDFIENSCYCKAMGRRTCACHRYGRICHRHERNKEE